MSQFTCSSFHFIDQNFDTRRNESFTVIILKYQGTLIGDLCTNVNLSKWRKVLFKQVPSDGYITYSDLADSLNGYFRRILNSQTLVILVLDKKIFVGVKYCNYSHPKEVQISFWLPYANTVMAFFLINEAISLSFPSLRFSRAAAVQLISN